MDVPIEKSVAEAPFNDPKADFILISSDGILFYIHRILLTVISPVFENSLPSPDMSQEQYDGRPCLTLEDEAKKLRLLLSWCDQRCTNRSTSLDDLQSVLELASKYAMDKIIVHVQDAILKMQNVIAAEPLRLFCTAAQFRLPSLAHAAAMEVLKTSVVEWTEKPEMDRIPGSRLIRLLQYHRRCVLAVQALVKQLGTIIWVDGNGLGPGRVMLTHASSRKDCTGTGWFEDYMKHVKEALKVCPSARTLDSTFNQGLKKIKNSPCSVCRSNAPFHFIVVQQHLMKEIEREIRQVEPLFGF